MQKLKKTTSLFSGFLSIACYGSGLYILFVQPYDQQTNATTFFFVFIMGCASILYFVFTQPRETFRKPRAQRLKKGVKMYGDERVKLNGNKMINY